MADEIRRLLETHWFKDGLDSMRAKVIVMQHLPDKDFVFQVTYGNKNDKIITPQELKNYIIKLKYGHSKVV